MQTPDRSSVSPPSAATPAPSPTNTVRVLITEDEFLIALDLQHRLQNLGYEVVGIASSGDDAILQIQEKRPHLVLMDVMIYGDMDGIETAHYVREHFDLPVIFLTANADAATLDRAESSHPFSYIVKPFKERELKFSMEMALYHHSVMRQLKDSRNELEHRVEARTAELAATNTALQNEVQQHKKTVEDLRAAQVIAKNADRAKNEFLATVSHELLTPMNGILGMTDLLLDISPSLQHREYLSVVKLSAETLLGIINDLLDFSRIEAGQLALSPTLFSLRDQIDACLRPLTLRAADKRLSLTRNLTKEVPDFVLADPVRLGQVLIHLVGNAIKFTQEGAVTVEIDQLTRDDERVLLHVAVRDTGIGVPVEKQEAIFEPFVQADNSFSRKHGGAGLGLSISRRLVELMGGTIWLESTPSAGSTFHFTFWVSLSEELNPLSFSI